MFRRFLLTAMVAVAVTVSLPTRSEATFTVTLTSGATTLTVTDGDANDLTNGVLLPNTAGTILLGIVSNPGAAPDILPFLFKDSSGNVLYSIALTSTAWSTAAGANLSSSTNIVIQNVGATAPLAISVKEDAFPQPIVNGSYSLINQLTTVSFYDPAGNPTQSNANGSVTATASASPDLATTSTVIANPSGTPTGLSSQTNFNKTATPFSLQQDFVVTLATGSSAQFQGNAMIAAPAPAGFVMLAGALPFAGLLRLRRRPTKAAGATAA